jgi:hypothetical protein
LDQTQSLASGIINRTTGPIGGLLLATAVAFSQKHFGCCIQVAGIALIGINVDLQLGCFVSTHEYIFKDNAAVRTADFQLHHVTITDTVMIGV